MAHRTSASCCRLAAFGVVLALLGCSGERPDSQAGADPLAGGDGRVEWQGALPCADCDAIETRLLLMRDGDDARYQLAEHFVSGDGGEAFDEDGRWRMQAGVLALEGADGARRHFAVLPDGRLLPSDAEGEPAPGDAGALMPVAAEAF